tara:strand:+ start:4858 stop:5985 length:1128 start_codon:yes stop_codon:yes gene_type:complete
MKIKNCRICSGYLYDNPIFTLKNMPKSAQYLPTEKDLGVDLEVCQCSKCGLVQLNNEPVPYYKEVIRATDVSEEMKTFRRKQFKSFIKEFKLKNKKVIEIGSGKGEYLELLNSCGVQGHGIEHKPESTYYCHDRNLNVYPIYLDNPNSSIPNSPFDAFCILNFFEHIPNPNNTLEAISHNISDEAIGLIEVPNFDMMIKHGLYSEFIGDHLFYFTEKTLSNTLERNGFDIVKSETIWYNYILSMTVKKRKTLDLSNFYIQQDKIAKELHEYINKFSEKRVAVYGAGHQALAVIALSDIGSKLKYIVDDATFKQGKFSPSSHVPIVSSSKLNQDPVDAVIIMAASYSDEVAQKLQNNHYNNIKVAILRQNRLEIIN